MDEVSSTGKNNQEAVVNIAIDSWRFSKLFLKVLTKLDAGDATRYVSQLKYYLENLEKNLESTGIKLVNIEGQTYDPGMAVKALNMEEFDADEPLLVAQMLEPIVMGQEGLIRSGTVMLGKAS